MLAAGFADPVQESQAVFRGAMAAMARPGIVQPVETALRPPAPLCSELGLLALTLCDHETPIWLDAPLRATDDIAAFLRFHTGAPITDDPAKATFALIAEPAAMPALQTFAQGTDAYPDRSTTLILALRHLVGPRPWRATGPGIQGQCEIGAEGMPTDFLRQWQGNNALFPCGVDLFLTAPGQILGLPRSIALQGES